MVYRLEFLLATPILLPLSISKQAWSFEEHRGSPIVLITTREEGAWPPSPSLKGLQGNRDIRSPYVTQSILYAVCFANYLCTNLYMTINIFLENWRFYFLVLPLRMWCHPQVFPIEGKCSEQLQVYHKCELPLKLLKPLIRGTRTKMMSKKFVILHERSAILNVNDEKTKEQYKEAYNSTNPPWFSKRELRKALPWPLRAPWGSQNQDALNEKRSVSSGYMRRHKRELQTQFLHENIVFITWQKMRQLFQNTSI